MDLVGGVLFDIGMYVFSFVWYFLSEMLDEVLMMMKKFEIGVDE